MKLAAGICVFVACAAGTAHACEGTRLPALIAAESYGKLAKEFAAEGIESSEGAAWQIFLGTQSGQPVNVVRTVYGEMGKQEDRLVIASAEALAIISTEFRYSAPITDPDMKIRIAAKTDYQFCGGKLERPAGMSDAAFGDYKAAAGEWLEIFRAVEVQSYLTGVALPAKP